MRLCLFGSALELPFQQSQRAEPSRSPKSENTGARMPPTDWSQPPRLPCRRHGLPCGASGEDLRFRTGAQRDDRLCQALTAVARRNPECPANGVPAEVGIDVNRDTTTLRQAVRQIPQRRDLLRRRQIAVTSSPLGEGLSQGESNFPASVGDERMHGSLRDPDDNEDAHPLRDSCAPTLGANSGGPAGGNTKVRRKLLLIVADIAQSRSFTRLVTQDFSKRDNARRCPGEGPSS